MGDPTLLRSVPLFTLTLLAVLQTADPLAVVVDRFRPDHDIIAYHIALSIPDSGTWIAGATTVRYVIRGGPGPLELDFDSVFTIDSIVPLGGRAVSGAVTGSLLQVAHWGGVGDTLELTVHYQGSPSDGLFIQPSVRGARTAFADNWPNRARHWFPGEDHPSDKAFASFAIEVPAGWKVVANGALQWVDDLPSGRARWHWRTDQKIPVYTMIFGAGPLTVTSIGGVDGPAQTLWTFAEDSAFAVDVPFRRVARIVEDYSRLIGPFPYTKLAHVQSSTRFGGMENSSAIFYAEHGYADRTMQESLVAHETAHQWFGDAVTEYDWHHLWLSEGFASYLEVLFYELVGEYGAFQDSIQAAKERYLRSDAVHRPVIDTTVTDLFSLLSANNYSKGAWILHMLRGEIGDSAFFGGLRDFYTTFRDSTALSSDLLTVMEQRAGQSLRQFFEQWLLQPGYPQLEVNWTYDPEARVAVVNLTQVQDSAWGVFSLDVPVGLTTGESATLLERTATFRPPSRTATVRFDDLPARPSRVLVDSAELLLTVTKVTEGS